MTTSGASLLFGDLPLLTDDEPTTSYIIEALGQGVDWGSPEATIASVASMLMDGDKAKITRFGNRQMTLPIQIRGADLDVVAAGEAALMAEVNKGRNTLTWKPPGIETLSVYDVVYATLAFNFVDLDEVRAQRHFTLTLTCIPGARPAEPTVVVADPIPSHDPTRTTIDNCTSLTGWSAPYSSTIEAYNGAIRTSTPTTSGGYVWMIRTGLSVPVSEGDYVVVEFVMTTTPTSLSPNFYFNVTGGNDYSARVAAVEPISADRARYYLQVPDGMTTLTSLQVIVWAYAGTNGPWVMVADVSKVDLAPFAGTRRQRSFTATIGGTARTSADLVVESDAALGGDVLVYTQQAGGFPPPLRSWLSTSSTVTLDSSMISGARQTLSSQSVYEFPATMLDGTYSIVAMVSRTTGSAQETIGWSASTDSRLATSATNASGSISATLTTTWRPIEIGVVTLPTVDVDPASDASVVLTITGSSTVRLDEVWLFRVTDDGSAELSWFTGLDASVDDPTKVEIRSAALDHPRPAWMVGTTGTDVDNVSAAARMRSPGKHQFSPGLMGIFVVTPGGTAQTVTVTAYDRHQHNVSPRTS